MDWYDEKILWQRVSDPDGRTGKIISRSRDVVGWVYVQWDDFFTCTIIAKLENLTAI